MKRFVDFEGKSILLSLDSQRHISEMHPEIEMRQIKIALKDPDEVRKSSYRSSSVLYYRSKTSTRLICVVVKACEDGYFISSAMTASKPKTGEVIYVRKH